MTTYTVGNDVQALVADIGSYSTKIGYAGDDHPQALYNSTTAAVRAPKHTSSSNFANPPKRDFTIRCVDGVNGDGDYELVNPVDPVTGWLFSPPSKNSANISSSLSSNEQAASTNADAWESHELVNHYLQHAFQHSLGLSRGSSGAVGDSSSVDYSHHHPLLLLDKSHTPPALRQRLLEILFETHNLPSVFFLRDAVAACYAVGRTTATVVDVGYSGTMVTPVYEGFVERSGVLRNNACGARNIEERVLEMMDGLVVSQGGRKRKERLRRKAKEKMELQLQQQAAVEQPSPKKTKRDDKGHFIKEKGVNTSAIKIPDYLMPLYQVKRGPPSYNPRKDTFHAWSRLALAREIKECGLGVAVGPMGYVTSGAATPGEDETADSAAAGEGGTVVNPAAANNMFLTSSKLPYTLPDGTNVEISTASRYDVVELYFGSDEQNSLYRDNVFDETIHQLEEYSKDVEDFITERADDGDGTNNEDDSKSIVSSSAGADPYSDTSYKGEKSSRYAGSRRNNKKTHYSPNVVSAKLYSACLPYLRTEPPNGSLSDEGGTVATNMNDNYFHYLTSASPAQMVSDSVFRCHRDQQAKLLGDVVVCGGGACITGASGVVGSSALGGGAVGGAASLLGDEQAFPDRLREEVEAIVHQHTPGWKLKVTSPNVTERAVCSWLGGSILGSLGTFQDMWISRKDYEEYGAAIVNRKCP